MNQIQEPANNNYDFGLDFNYAAWTANTDITLTNVPWDNNYRDVVGFPTTDALNKYIDKRPTENVRITNAQYAKTDQPISIDIPFGSAQLFNYVRVYNPAQPVHPSVGGIDIPKYYYYFILNIRHVTPNTTELQVQLDVFQTYIRNVRFGRCYVERGHIGIANQDQFRNYGRDFLSIPEGLDTGSEYNIVDRVDNKVMSLTDQGTAVGSSILVASTLDLTQAPGTVKAPNMKTARGSIFQGLPSGASYYIFTNPQDFLRFMQTFSDKPWITQGIISITVIPKWSRYYGSLGTKLTFGGYAAPQAGTGKRGVNFRTNWRNAQRIRDYIPERYRHLRKFWTFPYMAIRVSSNAGQQTVLRPEHWNSAHGEMTEMCSLLPPSQRITMVPRKYNSSIPESNSGDITGDGMDRAISIGNFPTLALVNNEAINFLASNANTLAFGFKAADWAQQKALRGNQVSYDQASAGMNASSDLAAIGMGADAASTAISNQLAQDSALLNGIGGAAGGAAMGLVGGPVGGLVGGMGGTASGVMGMLNTGNQINSANAQLANRMSSGTAAQGVQTGLAGYMRDTNKSLSDWAARGDYESAVAGMKAKIQDAEMSPPSVAGQAGGEALNLQNDQMMFRMEVIMPDQAAIQSIGEYWLRYGYAIDRNMFMPPSLQVMDKFTYWKLKETYLGSSPVPEAFKQAIRGIFEKGVTVWANPDDMGFIDPADNRPIPGIVIDGYQPPTPEPDPTPEPPEPITRRKRKKMLVYGTVSTVPGFEGNVWALAGASPGTQANWQETQESTRSAAFLDATGQTAAVGVTEAEFNALKEQFLSPVETGTPGGEVE